VFTPDLGGWPQSDLRSTASLHHTHQKDKQQQNMRKGVDKHDTLGFRLAGSLFPEALCTIDGKKRLNLIT